MTFEEFQVGALNLGYQLEMDKYGYYRFGMDGIGIAYQDGVYQPFGCFCCKYWSDDIMIEQLRAGVVIDGGAELALDYLELLSTLERIDLDTNTNG